MPPKMDITLVELLSEINRKLWKRLGPVARAQGLSLTEMLVLWKVNHRGSYRVTELAADIGLPPSTPRGWRTGSPRPAAGASGGPGTTAGLS